jgi:hypothetical protein
MAADVRGVQAYNAVRVCLANSSLRYVSYFTRAFGDPSKLWDSARRADEKGGPLSNYWGFIHCTIPKICCPTVWQQECYNGYKHMHALKYSAVKCPDGLLGRFCKKVPEGCCKDATDVIAGSPIVRSCLHRLPFFRSTHHVASFCPAKT